MTPGLPSFASQLNNKGGYYVGATLSIPIFGGLSRRTAVNRSRNNMLIAEQDLAAVERELRSEIEQNWRQMEGYDKEFMQAAKKTEAARASHRAVVQKFEQGVTSAIEVQISANRLLESESQQLYAQLQYRKSRRLAEYYQGWGMIGNCK